MPRMEDMPYECRLFSRQELERQFMELSKDNERMREALEFYANPDIYKPHPHGPAFDRRDLSFHARAALSARSLEVG